MNALEELSILLHGHVCERMHPYHAFETLFRHPRPALRTLKISLLFPATIQHPQDRWIEDAAPRGVHRVRNACFDTMFPARFMIMLPRLRQIKWDIWKGRNMCSTTSIWDPNTFAWKHEPCVFRTDQTPTQPSAISIASGQESAINPHHTENDVCHYSVSRVSR